MKFSQHVVVWTEDPEALRALFEDWNTNDATAAPGFLGGRLLAFRDKPGRYVIQADFESWALAQENSDRPETAKWAEQLNQIIADEPKYEDLDVLAEFP